MSESTIDAGTKRLEVSTSPATPTPTPASEIACMLGEAEIRKRADALRSGFLERIVEVVELPGGARLRFASADAETRREVAEFVEFESRCCGFARFEIETDPERDALWLAITGPEGTKEFLSSWIPLPRHAAAAGNGAVSASPPGSVGKAAAIGAGALSLCLGGPILAALGLGGLAASANPWLEGAAVAGLGLAGFTWWHGRRKKTGASDACGC